MSAASGYNTTLPPLQSTVLSNTTDSSQSKDEHYHNKFHDKYLVIIIILTSVLIVLPFLILGVFVAINYRKKKKIDQLNKNTNPERPVNSFSNPVYNTHYYQETLPDDPSAEDKYEKDYVEIGDN